MRSRWYLLFLLFLGFESSKVVLGDHNRPPQVGDAADIHNIGYSVAHGRGYSFDWNDQQWRKLWQDQNADGRFDFVLARHGSYPTMFRPPLMPVLVAGILELAPHHSFLAWRIFDSAIFAIAACLLCDVAWLHGRIIGLVALLAMVISDPLRRGFIPGWWTEGLAFALLSWIVWLIANGGRLRPSWYNVCAGLGPGLIKNALIILAVSALIQMPWWVRNIVLSGRMMPLGTQAGFNLPDEYSDAALDTGGEWTGRGISDAWIPPSETAPPIRVPKVANPDADDQRLDRVVDAAVCTSLQSEIAISAAGQRTAIAWMRANYARLPGLMARKAWSLTITKRRYLALAALLGVIGLFGVPKQRWTLLCLALLTASYVLAVAATHVVYQRFLMPVLPPLYVGMALGVTVIVRLAAKAVIRSSSPA